jgi:hypothetical protein
MNQFLKEIAHHSGETIVKAKTFSQGFLKAF